VLPPSEVVRIVPELPLIQATLSDGAATERSPALVGQPETGEVCDVQVVPPSVVLRMVPAWPTAHAVAGEAAATALRMAPVPDAAGRQLVPPSRVTTIVPPSPTAIACEVDAAATPRRLAVVPEYWSAHVWPPSLVLTTFPAAATPQPTLSEAKEVEVIGCPCGRGFCHRQTWAAPPISAPRGASGSSWRVEPAALTGAQAASSAKKATRGNHRADSTASEATAPRRSSQDRAERSRLRKLVVCSGSTTRTSARRRTGHAAAGRFLRNDPVAALRAQGVAVAEHRGPEAL
jgi:hypothetical protein